MEEISTMNRGAQSLPMKRKALTSVALAVAIVTSGLSFSAQALVLGQVRVNSALGEPLRAEVPVTQLSRDELSSLNVMLASPSDYSSRGFVYNSVLSSLRISFESTGGTTGVIRLSSTRTIQEPFLDLLVNVAWNSGSTQRNYTMLIDPPRSMVTKTPLVTDATQVSVLEGDPTGKGWQVKQGQFERPKEDQIDTPVTPATSTEEPSSVTGGQVKPKPIQPKPQPKPQPEGQYTAGTTVKVARGQTLGNIANAFKPSDVTTEQMLAALYKANPSAFINKNINWVRAGASLQIPDSSEIAAVTKTEARGLVSAHAREFNQYRRQAAGTTVTVKPTETGSRVTGGQIETAKTPEKAPSRGDELVIAHADTGTVGGQSVAEQQAVVTKDREAEIASIAGDAAAVLEQINGTAAATTTPPATTTGTEPVADGATGTNSEVVGAETPPPLAVGTEGEGIKIDAGPAETVPEQPAEVKPAEVVPPPAPASDGPMEQSFLDKILDNITMIVAGIAGLFVLIVLGIMLKRRRKAPDFDDSYDEGEYPATGADSFFAENHSHGDDGFMLDQSSSIYAASQLDTNVDVDPVQEADVYLAYGRDEQAIEILRDALDSDPNHIAINTKLTEIYARQNDVNAFNAQAAHLKNLTSGQGEGWERIVRLAQNIDPNNPLYAMGRSAAPAQGGQDEYASFDEPDTKSLNHGNNPMDYGAMEENFADDLDISLDNSDVENFSASLDDLDTMPSDMDFDASDEGPATRLALAEEFFAIGNKTDAKEIATEVISQATTAEVKKRAEQLLDKIA